MTGRVDPEGRALLSAMTAPAGGRPTEIEVWIDTAFTGTLTMPRTIAAELGLRAGASTDAVLADGSAVVLETFVCDIAWFNKTYRTQAVATDTEHPLPGTQLLAGRRLMIDYSAGTVELV